MHRGTITLNSFDRYFTKRHGRTFLRGVRKGLKYIIYIREENIGFRFVVFRVHAKQRLIVSPEFLEMKFLSFIVCLGDIKFSKQFLFPCAGIIDVI